MLVEVKDPVRLLRRIAVTVAGTVIFVVGVVLWWPRAWPGGNSARLGRVRHRVPMGQTNLAAVQARARRQPSRRQPAALPRPAPSCSASAPSASAPCWYSRTCCDCPGWGHRRGRRRGGLTVLLTTAYGVRELRNARRRPRRTKTVNRFGPPGRSQLAVGHRKIMPDQGDGPFDHAAGEPSPSRGPVSPVPSRRSRPRREPWRAAVSARRPERLHAVFERARFACHRHVPVPGGVLEPPGEARRPVAAETSRRAAACRC